MRREPAVWYFEIYGSSGVGRHAQKNITPVGRIPWSPEPLQSDLLIMVGAGTLQSLLDTLFIQHYASTTHSMSQEPEIVQRNFSNQGCQLSVGRRRSVS